MKSNKKEKRGLTIVFVSPLFIRNISTILNP